jgi:hypothetical protein
LQFGTNKGLDNNLITTEIKEVIEIHPNSRDMKKKVITTFEIMEKVEKVPIAFVVKEEVEKFERIKIVPKKKKKI